MSRLTFNGIVKRYGAVTAVNGVSMEIESGEFVSLVGSSGCGKTSLLRIIAGFTKPDAGELAIDGKRVEMLPPSKREVGFVFQSYALFPTQTVAQNIGFSLAIRSQPKNEIAARVEELCELAQLQGLEKRYPHELSGGQQQRVALARALAPNPSILLLDEPLSALDAKIRAHLRTEIRALVTRLGITAVYVTHDQEEALSISDRVAVMNDGRILQVGAPMDLYLKPTHRYVADFIGTSNHLEAQVVGTNAVKIEGMRIKASLPEDLSANDPCVACVRPEHIVLRHDGKEGSGTAKLTTFQFLGPVVRCRIVTTGGTELSVDVPTTEWLDNHLAAGETIAWSIHGDRAMIFPPDSGIAEAIDPMAEDVS